jgi:hypothetical protein
LAWTLEKEQAEREAESEREKEAEHQMEHQADWEAKYARLQQLAHINLHTDRKRSRSSGPNIWANEATHTLLENDI